jgi:hypothetical protein
MVLQPPQAKSHGENISRHMRERPPHPELDTLAALLLPKWLHHLSNANRSLSNLASMLRLNLFTYIELTHWIDDPMGTPPISPN